MPELRFENQLYQVDDLDSVLNTLLKHGHAIPNFCRSGYCHSCMLKAEEGIPLPFSQIGLADELVAENHFLSCQCAVYAPMTIRRPDKDKRTRFVARVQDKRALSDALIRLTLNPEHDFVYQAGQYTTLINHDGLAGDFPIASVHGDDPYMQVDVYRDTPNALTAYLCDELEVGDAVEIMTALGDAYYSETMEDQLLAIVAAGAELSCARSAIRKAISVGHASEMRVLCLTPNDMAHPLCEELESLGKSHAWLSCTFAAQTPGAQLGWARDALESWAAMDTEPRRSLLVMVDSPAFARSLAASMGEQRYAVRCSTE